MDPQTNTINLDTTLSRITDVVSAEIGEETVMLSIEHGMYYGMDEIGSLIWELLEQPRQVSEICDSLLARFDVERETCENEVLAFLNRLNNQRLLHVAEATPAT